LYLGTIAPGAYGFNSNKIDIQNQYILGYLEGKNLYFRLPTSYLLPTTITNGEIKQADEEIRFSADTSFDQGFFPLDKTYRIQSTVTGINFVFENIIETSAEEITPVNILIKNMTIGF
jgi:hypothetical protein